MVLDPASPSTVYAGSLGGGVFKSTDGAATWVAMNNGLTDPDVQALAINSTSPQNLYAGTNGGLFTSLDGGANWTPANSGLTNTDVLALAIEPSSPSTIYAGTNGGGLFKSTTSGASWTAANTGILSPRIIHAIAIDPTNPSTVYTGKASVGLVFKSTDAGQTWSDISDGLPVFPTFLSALAIDPVTPARIYAGTDSSGIFTAVGDGAWQPTGSVDLLHGAVEDLLAGGILTPDQSSGLMDKLDAAIQSIGASKTRAACGQLGAFVNQVRALIRNGTLSEEVGGALIDAAEAQRAQFGC
jgi:hypothetical protein